MGKLDFIDWVLSEMQARRIRRIDISRAGKISSGHVSHVLNRESMAGVDFCRAIAKTFEMSEHEVFYRAGISSEKPMMVDQPWMLDVLEAARKLAPDERKDAIVLMDMLRKGKLKITQSEVEDDA